MLRDPVVITPKPPCARSNACLTSWVSGFPVLDGGKVVGIVTGRDLRFESRNDLP